MLRRLCALILLVFCLLFPASPAASARQDAGLTYTTGYTWTGHRTSTGVWPVVGRTVAVDKNIIPLGSWVYISGIGWRHAEDTGVYGNHVDVFVGSVSAAYAITRYRYVYWVRGR